MSFDVKTRHGALRLPAFLPDATRAFVRCVDSEDLANSGIEALMVNAYHVAQKPGTKIVSQHGGLHAFMGWDRPIVTDSGGFQVLSIIRSDPKHGSISPKGVTFRDPDSGEKVLLTPEKSIMQQFRLGSDVVIALDDCTGPTSTQEELETSVTRTLKWFERAKDEYDRQVTSRKLEHPPMLVGVVQGGHDPQLRERCATTMVEKGADALGFGGWPVDESGALEAEAFDVLVDLAPKDSPIFALGIGKPSNLVQLVRRSPRIVFDCTLPTRDARHGRLYSLRADVDVWTDDNVCEHLYIFDKAHRNDPRPIAENCDCLCCSRYSRAYLFHLFRCKDPLAFRLATLHNLRFYKQLIDKLRTHRP